MKNTSDDTKPLEALRHTLAHLLAAAVLEQHPDAKPTIGPAIENGFYYDFDFSSPLSPDELPALEKSMKKILKNWKEVVHREVSGEDAQKIFANNQYKLELIQDIIARNEPLTLYRWGNFEDLCRGGHVDSTASIHPDSFTLSKLAGAYWRGSEKNKMLTRIYGLAFATKEELSSHLTMLKEAEKRDHRKLGKELELFTIIDEVGPGLPLFYPKGAILRRLVENFIIDEQEKRGYVPIWIPHITKENLYKISGHLDKYDAMFPPMMLDDDSYYLKPMNCPHFMALYNSRPHSYRDLPLRYTSNATVYRYEKSGELSGLTRVRALTQDDCHVFCTPEQIETEIEVMLDMIIEVYRVFNLMDFKVRISTHDPNKNAQYIGGKEYWSNSEQALKDVVARKGISSEVGEGEAAFYGPKLDFMVKDAIGREWQLSTIQLDYNLPERFLCEYIASDNTKKHPIVIHRAILGSTERFLAVIIEHFGGAFPVWLSPVQVVIIPVGLTYLEAARLLSEKLKSYSIRVEVDEANESVGKKIRTAEKMKTPFMIVIGEKEADLKTLSVRRRGSNDTQNISPDAFIEMLTGMMREKRFSFENRTNNSE